MPDKVNNCIISSEYLNQHPVTRGLGAKLALYYLHFQQGGSTWRNIIFEPLILYREWRRHTNSQPQAPSLARRQALSPTDSQLYFRRVSSPLVTDPSTMFWVNTEVPRLERLEACHLLYFSTAAVRRHWHQGWLRLLLGRQHWGKRSKIRTSFSLFSPCVHSHV